MLSRKGLWAPGMDEAPWTETVERYRQDLVAIRHDLHANPELGLELHRTADVVAAHLQAWGIEVHRGVGGTGVVGVIRQGNGERSIGLRADMDALPIHEATSLPYASQTAGLMHACGHDGHTTMLLGAARYLAETRNFSGTVHLIFQPGEEGAGGALAMLADGLFERFPCDHIFGLHNRPGAPVGDFSLAPGTAMAGGAFFDVILTGKGAHAARPNEAADPVVAACHLGAALQTIVSRNVRPSEMAVVSVTRLHAGDTYNVIPGQARLSGTARALSRTTMSIVEDALRRIAAGIADAFGVAADVNFRLVFAPLVNDAEAAALIADTAAELVGDDHVDRLRPPAPSSEDFSFMLERVPGAYINVGNGLDCAPVHNARYDFNDGVIPYGVGLFARLVERALPAEPQGSSACDAS